MIIPSALFVLASYVGPEATPDGNRYKNYREESREARKHSDYAMPGINRNYYANSSEKNKTPKPKTPKPGRMVVPEKFL